MDTLDSHQNGLNVHENDHQFCKDGLDDHQKGDDGNQKREEYNGQENCKRFLPLLENMIIFMIPDISILCVDMWRFGYDFQLENETQSTTDS